MPVPTFPFSLTVAEPELDRFKDEDILEVKSRDESWEVGEKMMSGVGYDRGFSYR